MLTSSTSPTLSSSPKGRLTTREGFSLVELLISIAIIGMVTSLVLVRYNSFDSTVLLKSLAYEIALTLREAQVRSVSVSSATDDQFDYPYGVHFTMGKSYTSFYHTGTLEYPLYGTDTTDIRTFSIGRTMEVRDLCVQTNIAEDCSITSLDVSFKRPKFKGIFNANGYSQIQAATIESAKIKVGSSAPGTVFVVTVTNLGQISVSKE